MANTENGIFYNDDYNSIADVLLDEKKMAESVDEQLKVKKEEIEEVSKKNIEQDNSISELQEEIENLRNISNIMPSVNETGENITLNNTAKNVRFRKFKVGGNVKQETRSGKNLFKTIQTSTKNGMTLTNNKDGSYTLSGTTTAATSFYVSNLNYSAGVYAISANNSVAVSNDSFYISVEHANGRVTQTFTLINMKKTAGTGVINALSIVLPSGLTLNNFIIKPQLEVVKSTSDSATEFEQYGAMPSIDYTSKIKTVGSNINIFDITKYDYREFNEASVEITDSTNFRIIATTSKNANNAVGFKVMDLTNYAGKTLTLKAKVKSSTSTNKGFLVLRQNNADYTGTKSNEKYDETQNTTDGVIILQYKVADTINDSNRYLFAWFFATRGSECNVNDYVDYTVKMVEGTEAGEYSKYNQGSTKIIIEKSDKTQKQEYIMPVQKEFLTDDYFDLDNEEEVHGWNKLVLTGEEDWSTKQTSDNSVRFQAVLLQSCLKDNEGCSNYFKVQSEIDSKQSCGISVYAGNATMYVWIPKTVAETVETFKTWLKSLYDAGTPVVVYYKTATETRILFTDEQKAVAKEIQKATSYEDTTHIYSTDEVSPVFDVEAVADIRKLIANISTTAEGER